MNKIEELSAARRKNKILIVKKFNMRKYILLLKNFSRKVDFIMMHADFYTKEGEKNAKNPKLIQDFTA